MIGALRGVAQTVSYEVRFALIILVLLIRGETLRLSAIVSENNY
jgi:NADH:ubiquinone oxidoreductase subunit H